MPESKPSLSPMALQSLTLASALERIDRLNRREGLLLGKVDDRMERWVNGYLAELNLAFYNNFVNQWDLGVARTKRIDSQLIGLADETLDLLGQDLANILQGGTADGYRDGFLLTAWDVTKLGLLPVDEAANLAVPPDDLADTWLELNAIGGLTMVARLWRWMSNAKLRFRTVLRGAIATGATLNDTTLAIETLADQLLDQVGTLGSSELQRSFGGGQQDLLARVFGDDEEQVIKGELWLTRRDGQVCPQCAELQGKITTLKPVLDTHPLCRCIKVPLFTLDSEGFSSIFPVSFDDFEAWLTAE